MPEDLKEQITTFVGYFRNQLDWIARLKSDGHYEQLYKKILYVTVLDALSKAVYPKRGNRERLILFIKEFSKWKDAERVSLTHLVQLLKRTPEPAFEDLRKYAAEKFSAWPVHASQIVNIDIDPDINAVTQRWPVEKEHRMPIEKVSLESLQHCYLFYTYRNSLVHEFRYPGRGMEFADNDYPYYHLMSELKGYNDLAPPSVELVYPVRFFHQLCIDSLDHFEQYILRNNLNPYDYYTFGTYWIEELNA
jgi:hypothetical protein